MKFILIFLLVLLFSCKSISQKEMDYYRWEKNNSYRLEIRDEFVKVFEISDRKLEEYIQFSQDRQTDKSVNIDTIKDQLKDEIAEAIVKIIMSKLEMAFGEDLLKKWQLESTSLPVKFRTFIKKKGNNFYIKEIALIEKKDLEIRSLIRFLPLEYKMQFMGEQDKKNLIDPIPILD